MPHTVCGGMRNGGESDGQLGPTFERRTGSAISWAESFNNQTDDMVTPVALHPCYWQKGGPLPIAGLGGVAEDALSADAR